MISRKIDREHYVFSLEMSQGGIEASLEMYRGAPFTRVSMCLFEMNLKSFLPLFSPVLVQNLLHYNSAKFENIFYTVVEVTFFESFGWVGMDKVMDAENILSI